MNVARTPRMTPRSLTALVAACLFCVVALTLTTQSANANVTPSITASYPTSTTAGAHSNYRTLVNLTQSPSGDDIRRLAFDYPAGLVGDPNAITAANRCNVDYTGVTAGSGSPNYGGCPASSRIGSISVRASSGLTCSDINLNGSVYLLRNRPSADPEVPVHLGISVSGNANIWLLFCVGVGVNLNFTAKITLRPTDQGLRVQMIDDLTRTDPIIGGAITVEQVDLTVNGMAPAPSTKPFLTNPTRCDAWVTTAYARAYDSNGNVNADIDPGIAGNDHVAATSSTTPSCSGLAAYNPTFTLTQSNNEAGRPVGLLAELENPVSTTSALQPAYAKVFSMPLPVGFRINPAIANRLGANGCTEAQFNQANPEAVPTCPATTQVGTVAVAAPEITGDLGGRLYLGHPQAGDVAARRYRLYAWAARGGVAVKFQGRATVDAVTGQVTVTFGDSSYSSGLPQFNYSKFTLDFDTASTGVGTPSSGAVSSPNDNQQMLVNPQVCGTYAAVTTFTPWTNPTQPAVTRSNDLEVEAGTNGECDFDSFSPTFSASVSDTGAGKHPNLNLTVTRGDRQDNLRDMVFTLPDGFGGAVTAATICTPVDVLADNCLSSSQVGSVSVLAGTGPETATLNGTVYLTEADPGDTAKLAIVVPAVVGPFDLGDVVIYSKLTIEGSSSFRLRASTLNMPQSIEGIPVLYRSIAFSLNGIVSGKPFLQNPSKCQALDFDASITSNGDLSGDDPGSGAVQTSVLSDTDQSTTGCASQTFDPDFSVTANATTTLETAKPTGFDVNIGVPQTTSGVSGSTIQQSTIDGVQLTMPEGMEINPAFANTLAACSTALIDAGGTGCPAESQVGSVTVVTPLLPDPVLGKVFVETPGTTAADRFKLGLVLEIPGGSQVVHGVADVNGSSDLPGGLGSKNTGTGQITATFNGLPDVPYSSLVLSFDGTTPMFVNPEECATHTFDATISPTNSTLADSDLTSEYFASYDGAGAACPGTDPWNPSFTQSVTTTTANGHPTLSLTTLRDDKEQLLRDIEFNLPAGLTGAPTATDELCSQASADAATCASTAPASILGTVFVSFGSGDSSASATGSLYNTVAPADSPAKITANVPVVVGPYNLGSMSLPVDVALREDLGLTATTTLPQRYEGIAVRYRGLAIVINGLASQGTGSAADDVPFLTNPSKCQLNTTTAALTSTDDNTVSPTQSYTTDGCPVEFGSAPTLEVTPSTTVAGDPVGLTIGIGSGADNPTIGRVELTMPEGVEINPAFGDNVAVCSTAEIDAGTCDPADAIADVTLTTHLLAAPQTGKLYLETPGATDTSRYRVAMIVELPGRTLTVRGSITVDGSTTIAPGGTGSIDSGSGQIYADFDDIPDLGFTDLEMQFASGANAMLVNPTTCTSATFDATITPNSGGAAATPSDSYTPTSCSTAFNPTFSASVSSTQAAGHPDLTLNITRPDKHEDLRDLSVDLPVGLVANTTATSTRCEQSDATAGDCQASEAVGSFTASIGSGTNTVGLTGGTVYNVVPDSDEPARLQAVIPVVVGPFDLGKLSVPVATSLRSDLGVTATTQLPLRYEGIAVHIRSLNLVLDGMVGGNPFVTNPSKCQLNTISGEMTSDDASSNTDSSSFTTTGCDTLTTAYDPSVSVSVDPNTAGTPTNFSFDLDLPAESSSTNRVRLTMPEGMEISPGVGDALVACSEAQINAGGAACLATTANLGTVELTTPLLPGTQTGNIFLETPGTTAATRYKLAIVVDLPGQLLIVRGGALIDGSSELVGGLGSKNTGTGQIVADFPNLPDLGFTNLSVAFDTSGNKLLVNPKTCATHSVGAEITPSSSSTATTRSASFDTVNGTCDNTDFAPVFSGSLSTSISGSNPDLNLSITNPNGTQELRSFAVDLPVGLVANTTAVDRCSQVDANAGNCAPENAVGTVTTTIGSGSETLALPGTIYNVTPNADQPARLQAIVPVVVGPFDLGKLTIPVPTSLNQDLSVRASATLPHRYEGIAVRVRSLAMAIEGEPGGDKFMVAPSECGAKTVNASMTSDADETAVGSFGINITGCPIDFGSAPAFEVTPSTTVRSTPVDLTFKVTSSASNPTINRVQVAMPEGIEINPAFGNGLQACDATAIDAGGDSCPAASQVGTASLKTQLLDPTVDYTGKVFLETPGTTANTRFKLALVIELPGADLVVRGKVLVNGSSDLVGGVGSIDSGTGQITADFDDIPDLGFTELEMAFSSATPMLVNPTTCSSNVFNATISPSSGGADSTPSSAYSTTPIGCSTASFASNTSFSASVDDTTVGAHPNLTLSFDRTSDDAETLADFDLELPVGLVASTTATDHCSQVNAALGNCSVDEQVGEFATTIGNGASGLSLVGQIYNVAPDADEPARLAAVSNVVVGPYDLGKLVIPIFTELRSDLGVNTFTEIPSRYEGIAVRMKSMDIELYGYAGPESKPFISNPSKCQSNTITARLTPLTGSLVSKTDAFTTTGCPRDFDVAPTVGVVVNPSETTVPTALDVTIGSDPVNPTISRIQVALPSSMSINAAVGNGLQTCSTALIDAGGSGCPAESNQGTVELTTPLLGGTYSGNVFLEDPGSTADTRYKLAIVVQLPGADMIVRGAVKIDGSTTIATGATGSVDGGSGQITTDFDSVPDLAFSEMNVSFNTGPRALLTNPDECGTHTVNSVITPSSGGADENIASDFETSFDGAGAACPGTQPFSPSFTATAATYASGANTDLELTVDAGAKEQALRNFNLQLPAGLVADTTATPRCTQVDAADGNCAANTQVGTLATALGTGSETLDLAGTIHNVEPNADEPARLAAILPVVVGPYDLGKLSIPVPTALRASDYGVNAETQIPLRYEGIAVRIKQMVMDLAGEVGGNGFIKNPSSCDAGTITADLISSEGANVSESSAYTATGCPLDFAVDPTITVSGTEAETAVPTGLTLDIASDPSNSSISAITTTMPTGMSINPAVGNNLDACSTSDIDAGGDACPTESQIGTVELVTPLLPGTQLGKVYLETPGGTAATRYRLAIVVDLPGTNLIARGTATVDGSSDLVDGLGSKNSGTGDVVASFPSIPDLNFTSMQIAFASGPDALFVNAEACGTQTVSAEFSPHSGGSNATDSDDYTTSYDGVGAACPGTEPFSPTFDAAVSTTQAAGNPDLTLTVTRPDKNEQLRDFNLDLPPGLVADTVQTPRCEQADSLLGNCAADSRVGTVTTAIGTGSETLALSGALYNVVPDNDEPARLAAVIDVQVGPYDLGKLSLPVTTEIVTGALPSDLAISTETAIPERYEGVPVRIREMQIQIDGIADQGTPETDDDKPFMINPSQCATHTITANMISTEDTAAAESDTFTTTDCDNAPYNPTIEADFSTTEVGKPVGLDLAFVFAGNSSSTKSITTSFPEGMEVNPGVGNGLAACDPAVVDAGGGACPAGSELGTVKLDTPLLPTQQTGKIYLETPGSTADTRYKLGIFIDLPGSGDLVVHGRALVDGSSEVVDGLGSKDTGTGRVTAEFDDLPDLQFSRLEINFNTTGGSDHALLTNPTTCGTFDVDAELSPWSRPLTTESASDSFTTDYDGGGAACPGTDPQNPSFAATLTDYTAGASGDLTLTISRPDKDQGIKKVKILLPPGLVGSADAAPTCGQASADLGTCEDTQPGSKIGDVELQIGDSSDLFAITGGLYNTVAPSNRPAKFTFAADVQVGPFDFGKIAVPVDVNLDANDYSLYAETGDMPQRFEGIPVRINQMVMQLDGIADQATIDTADDKPFLSNPRSCSTTLSVNAEITSPSDSTVDVSAPLAGPFTGCENLNLDDNTIAIENVNKDAEQPTALNVEVSQGTSGTQATMKDLNLALPGFRLNAPAANGLAACSASQLDAQNCPANSEVGIAWIDTSLLPKDQVNPDDGGDPNLHSLWGKIYLETPGNAPDGSDRYKLAIQLSGKTLITIRGVARVNETTGEITTEFTDLPDIPFETFRVELTGATNPLLLNPIGTVGAASQVTAQTTMTSHAGTAPRNIGTQLDVNAASAKTFSPTTAVNLSTTQSGAHPNALFTIARGDGQEDIRNVDMSLPAGFLGSAASVVQCPLANAAAGSCSASSKVGTVQAKIGQAGQVLTLPGEVFLTAGAYGDIAGMSIKVPAIAGPYNLGDFITQGRIIVRPTDHGLTVNFSDVPRLFKGVPTHIQELQINLPGIAAATGRPFLFNASSCTPFNIVSTMAPYAGANATSTVPYQATNCPVRAFAPSISFAASGGSETDAPSWTIKISGRPNDSTLRSATVHLPTIMTVNIQGIGTVCEAAQANARACPANTRVGSVTIQTPLLTAPVVGNVFVARSVSGSTLPDLLIEIPPPINMQVRGANRFINQIQIESTFQNLPDLIWSDMTMQIAGGPTGLIGIRDNGDCGPAMSSFGSHSGQVAGGPSPVVGIDFCGAGLRKLCENPKVAISTRGVRKRNNKKSSTSITFSSDRRCAGIKSFKVVFPKGSKLNRKQMKYSKKKKLRRKLKKNLRNVVGKFGKKRMKTTDFKAYGRRGLQLKGNLPKDVNVVTMATKNSTMRLPYKTFCGAVKGKNRKAKSRALKRCKKKKVTFVFIVSRYDGTSFRYNYKVKAGDRRLR